VVLRVNNEIRGDKIRLIADDGSQLGIVSIRDALKKAEEANLDLVEIAPQAKPPVCKIMNFGKYRYQQTKKERESKKSQHQVRVKEIKLKPNIDVHDLQTKTKHAKDFLLKGNKVRVSCMFRGREMLHVDLGEKVVNSVFEELQDIAVIEFPLKMAGRTMALVLAPKGKNKK
jgi:translation initiation factor IF-3